MKFTFADVPIMALTATATPQLEASTLNNIGIDAVGYYGEINPKDRMESYNR